ncbi:site-2 protease family protein [Candidatus Saccharibacteria bacterium]|nr:site-2 protease family protein [Candidatus Saccharibacteria bacterium]
MVVIVLLIVVGSVILHELAHGAVAYFLGDRTAKDAGRLTLNPLKHIDPYMSIIVPVILYLLNAPVFGGAKPVPIDSRNLKWREWGLALVAIAGPLTNFLIAFIAFLIGHFAGLLGVASGSLYYLSDSLPAFIVAETVVINLGFMIFNLIPIPPLDGSRVLYALAPDAIREYMRRLEPYGFIIVYALILIFGQLFSNLMFNGIDGMLNFFQFLV